MAFPSLAARIYVHPPAHHLCIYPSKTQPLVFLVKGLSPEQANTLIKAHLWLSQSIGFITIELHTYSPTSYVTALKDMAINLDEASKVITAVTIQMTTPKKPIHDTLKELRVSQQRIASMVNRCQAIPRGHTLNSKEIPKNIKEKKNQTSNTSIN